MLSLKANHAERVAALREAFERLATRFLSDVEPDDESVGLLLLVITDAALSGDRALLAGAEEAIERLNSYLDRERNWADNALGRLWTLEQLVDLSAFLLREEERLSQLAIRHGAGIEWP